MEILLYIIKQIFGNDHHRSINRLNGIVFRSVGVILYTLLSGLSPFLDETEEQTCANIQNIDLTFPDSLFPRVFDKAKELIQSIFVREPK